MKSVLGVAAQDIPANTVCYIGGSSDWLPLITIACEYCADSKHGISIEDAHFGGFIRVTYLVDPES